MWSEKKDGEKRQCVVYACLNEATVDDIHPPESLEGIGEYTKGKVYFSSIDLKNGYFHIPIVSKIQFVNCLLESIGFVSVVCGTTWI